MLTQQSTIHSKLKLEIYDYSYRIDDYYTKIKIDKLFSIYNEEMIEGSINDQLRQQLFSLMIQVLQYVS
jgi:hypothetical protein